MGFPKQTFIGTQNDHGTCTDHAQADLRSPVRFVFLYRIPAPKLLAAALMSLSLTGFGGIYGCGQKGDLYLPTSQPSKPPMLEEEDKRSPQKGSSTASPAEAASGV